MKTFLRFATLTVLVCVCCQMFAFASEDAYLLLVQGLPGRNVSPSADPALPVDVLINNTICYLRGFTFGNVNGPLSLPPGTYDVKISPADTLHPCTNAPLVESSITLTGDEHVSAVLTQNDSGTTVLETFTNNLQPVAAGNARLVLDYAGASSPVTFVVKSATLSRTYVINPGQNQTVTIPAGTYDIQASVGGVTMASQTVDLPARSVDLMFAVGNTATQSLSFISRIIRDVF